MSHTFPMNSRSRESLKVSVRCGCKANARQIRWNRLKRLDDQPPDGFIADPARCPGTGLIEQPIAAIVQEASVPFPDVLARCSQLLRHRHIALALSATQHDARTPCQGLSGFRSPHPALKLRTLLTRELRSHSCVVVRHPRSFPRAPCPPRAACRQFTNCERIDETIH